MSNSKSCNPYTQSWSCNSLMCPTGNTGPTGIKGDKGDQGPAGGIGQIGSLFSFGVGPPPATTPIGTYSFYLDASSKNIWRYNVSWNFLTSLVGSTGPTGPIGTAPLYTFTTQSNITTGNIGSYNFTVGPSDQILETTWNVTIFNPSLVANNVIFTTTISPSALAYVVYVDVNPNLYQNVVITDTRVITSLSPATYSNSLFWSTTGAGTVVSIDVSKGNHVTSNVR